jgi:hypothetical protein
MANHQEAEKWAAQVLGRHMPNCPVCEHDVWETGRIYNESALKYDGPTEPQAEPEEVEVVCSQCGYVVRFKTKNLLKYEILET